MGYEGISTGIYNYLQIANVLDFNADPKGNLSCSRPFEDAIQYLVSVKAVNGIVWVPAGTYVFRELRNNLSCCIQLPSNITILGVGPASHLRLANDTFLSLIYNSNFSAGNTNCGLKNIRVNGNRLNNASGSADGVVFNNVADLILEDVVIDNCRGDGLWLDSLETPRLTRVYSHDNGRNGIGTSNVRFPQFTDCRTIDNARTTAG
ncbi:MAG: glycosyl hydrolase family 28-related protein, partial [Armatimonadota bacterium]|nr:glycosyl hydrolase family 28-related protein [Armatimonadota bacterium]